MPAVFLSASVPQVGRGHYHETADPFLIQCAVRELVIAVIKTHLLVWGGHPSITPMIWSICEDLGVDYSKSVVLYQSRYFEDRFPEENEHFRNVNYIDAVPGDLDASLLRMRECMLSRNDLSAAVFVGGMEGVEAEHKLFKSYHPKGTVLPVSAPGGAARDLAQTEFTRTNRDLETVNFARLYYLELVEPLLKKG